MKRALTISLLLAAVAAGVGFGASNFVQKNLVADVSGVADNTDPNLVGTWGMSTSPTSPFWVSNTSNGTSTLYNTAGVPQALVAIVPPSASRQGMAGTPTGQVWNGLGVGAFEIAPGKPASFIFATLDGTISGWASGVGDGRTAILKVDNGASNASYLGLAIGVSAAGPTLYAANFASGKIDTFNATYAPMQTAGGFLDRDMLPGYSPTNIQRFGRRLYVTYAQSNGSGWFATAPGSGLINAFDLNGNLLQRLIPYDPVLNAPWGLAVSGANFGVFSYALLVGNFGDGAISAFDLGTGDYIGTMQDGKGNTLSIDGLWGLQFGNGGNGGDAATLYFAAAPSGGQHGLFGSLRPASDSLVP